MPTPAAVRLGASMVLAVSLLAGCASKDSTGPATIGAASQLALTTSAAGAASGAAFTTQPVVAIRDASSNTVTSANSTVVTMTVSAGGSMVGTATATASSGVATFSTVGITGTVGTAYTLTFASGSLTAATQSITPTIGAASQLVLTTSAATAITGGAFGTQPVVAIRDAGNNTRTADHSTVVTMTVSAGGSVVGTATATASSGVATFSTVGITGTSGTAYTLTYASGSLTSATQSITPTSASGAVTGLAVATVAAATVAGTAYASSTKLHVTWSAPTTGTAPTRYDVSWTDQGTSARQTTSVTATNVSLTDLKSQTTYKVEVTACTTTACASGTPPFVSTETPIEVWHLQGTGNTVAGLTKIVSDGNVKLHVMRYGTDAPGGLAGKLQLYYGPMPSHPPRLIVGTISAAAVQATTSTWLSFTSLDNSSGLISPAVAATLVKEVATGMAVPLSASLGSKVRLFFEAIGADGKTRILYVDSQDGYVGVDFNSGAPTTCSTTTEYTSGGACAPTVVIGVEGDATNSNPRISNARQFKLGYPTLTDWRWDGTAGTFMVFTIDAIAGCATGFANHGYAVWSGTAWTVQYVSTGGCPKLFNSAQAMYPVHLGGVRYKAYYGNPSDITGKGTGLLPFLGPKMLIYADGALTGTATRVDFEDWEGVSAGRRVTFLWPDGSTLNATANGYIDDFSIMAPTANLAWQVYYVAITDGVVQPFTSAALLINP